MCGLMVVGVDYPTGGFEVAGAGVYHAARNQFERFRGFLELISRFEFEFRRRGNCIF